MKTRHWILLLTFCVGAGAVHAQRNWMPAENVTMIVVTGLRFAENDPAGERADYGVAEGATVTVTARKDGTRTKPTTPFNAQGRRAAGAFLTADFSVNLDETYEIVMTFKDGTVIRVPDYRLPKEWKTHFYFHNTTGTKSPASVLRSETDARTGNQCRIYAVFPHANYQALGGTAAP